MSHELVSWLYGLQRLGVKLGLEGIRELLERLGRPDRSYRTWLVGGTNGKGSVAAMLDALLRAHGVTVGLYTSPHLVRPNERIRIGGDDVSDGDLAQLLGLLRATCESGLAEGRLTAHPSFFEVMTAAAMEAFRRAGVETAVFEVGLGGRLDATNAADPEVSVVVTVDHDHGAVLGATLGAIAGEKAGIARPGRPLVSGVVPGEANDVLRERAAATGALFVDARSAALLEDDGGGRFQITTDLRRYPRLTVPLEGDHQRENARVAIVAFERGADAIGLRVDPDAVARGFAAVRWPGRLQWIPGLPPLLLDGAHNAAGAAALARWLDARPGPKPVLLFAAMRDKDVDGILGPLASRAEAVVCTRPGLPRAAEPDELATAAARWNRCVSAAPDAPLGLEQARARALRSGKDGYVLVAGSLYLVGEVLGLVTGTPGPGPVPL